MSLHHGVSVLRHGVGDVAMRLRRADPARRFRSERRPVRVRRLIHLVGLKRSGLHAVANWLLGTVDGAALLNNSPMKDFGTASPMARTQSRSPLPVYLHRHQRLIALDDAGREIRSRLHDDQPLLVVLWQSQAIGHLADGELLRGVIPARCDTVLLLRDPFNWLASVCRKAGSTDIAVRQLDLWMSYAREYAGATALLGADARISFNRWYDDAAYRCEIAASLALPRCDRHFASVTTHAGGSSFDGTAFHGRAHLMRLTDRWQHLRDDERYRSALWAAQDAADAGLELFDLPDNLRRFARTVQRNVA